MKIAIHPDKLGSQSYSEKWKDLLKERNVEVKNVNLWENDVIDQIKGCNGVMWRWNQTESNQAALKILTSIEKYLNIPIFPSSISSWHYDDKISQNYLFKTIDAPTPETWIFWQKSDALNWIEKTYFPKVFKLSAGASSNNVIIVENKKQAELLINEMFSYGLCSDQNIDTILSTKKTKKIDFFRLIGNIIKIINIEIHHSVYKYYQPFFYPSFNLQRGYCYFQEFLPENDYDTRVTIIGDRAFCFRRFNREDDFRASGSGKLDFNPDKIDRQMIKMSFEISQRFNFECMAYDFLYKNGKPCVVEMSYTFADWAVERCPGHWNRDLDWFEGNMWPEEAQIIDFLDRITSDKLIK